MEKSLCIKIEYIHIYVLSKVGKDPWIIKELCSCAQLLMCPICPIPMCPITPVPHLDLCIIMTIAIACAIASLPMWPSPCTPSLMSPSRSNIIKQNTCSGYISHVPFDPTLTPSSVMGWGGLIYVSCVKLSKYCQKVKHLDYGGCSKKKKKIDKIYWCQFWCHTWWWPEPLRMSIESILTNFN